VYDYDFPLPQYSPMGDRLLFAGQDNRGIEPWVTDGTPEGTHRLIDLQPGSGSSNPSGLVSTGPRVYFSADDGTHGRELWESDGAHEGSRMVVGLPPWGYSSIPSSAILAIESGSLFFAADDCSTGLEPWARPLEP